MRMTELTASQQTVAVVARQGDPRGDRVTAVGVPGIQACGLSNQLSG